jgi:two-component system cell cycle response regulator
MVRALDLGVNDVVQTPIDRAEINVRIKTLIQRKSYTDALRDRLEESLELSVTDAMTGLFNRRYLMSRVRQGLETFRTCGEPFALAMIDLDHFKAVNDEHGHLAGDRVIKGFAERVGRELRAVDIAARFGGEEFMVLFGNSAIEHGLEATERLRADIAAEPFIISPAGDSLTVTISAGLTQVQVGDDVDDLIERADRALYDAKASGRNQVRESRKSAA